MSLRLYLDGRRLDLSEHSPLGGADLTLRRRDGQGQAAASFAGSVTFFGDARQRLRQELIDAPDARFRVLPVRIEDDCCGLTLFRGQIAADAVDWCEGQCDLTATLTEAAPDADALDCLRRTPVSDDRNGFRSRVHPFVRHCIELRPALLQDLVLIFAMLLNFAALIFYPVVLLLSAVAAALQSVVSAVNGLCGGCLQNFSQTISVSILDEYNYFIDRLNDLVIGCGRGHISPFVRDYLNNVCEICGLTADPRSVFHDPASPYYDSVYFSAPVHKGSFDYLDGGGNPIAATVSTYWKLNGPNLSGYELLEQLQTVFDARWRVEGGALRFETDAPAPAADLDWARLEPERRIDLCYRWLPDPPPAWARFTYAIDAVDWVGNEARDRWNAWVDYTQPWGPPTLRGERSVNFPFGTARFRDDGVDRDVLTDYRSFPFIGPRIRSEYDELLLLPVGVAFQPKLLTIDTGSPVDNARVRWTSMPGGRACNRDYWMRPDAPDGLYARFWRRSDPRLTVERGLEFRLTFAPTCAELAALRPEMGVRTPAGTGVAEQIQVGEGRVTVIGRL